MIPPRFCMRGYLRRSGETVPAPRGREGEESRHASLRSIPATDSNFKQLNTTEFGSRHGEPTGRNDGKTYLCDLAARFARVLAGSFRPLVSEGAGNAGRPMRPIAACAMIVVERTRVSQVTPETPGIPRAMVYGLFRALPGDRALLPPSFADRSATLTPASGRQDHTTSPSASSALVLRRHQRPPQPASRP